MTLFAHHPGRRIASTLAGWVQKASNGLRHVGRRIDEGAQKAWASYYHAARPLLDKLGGGEMSKAIDSSLSQCDNIKTKLQHPTMA